MKSDKYLSDIVGEDSEPNLEGTRCPEKQAGPEVMQLYSCSNQLSVDFFLLINVKMPTIVGILTVMSGKNSNLGLSEPKKLNFLIFLYL